jgi:hypothetical protein
MANMKLQDYNDASDVFTFPYNPNSVEFVNNKNLEKRNVPYYFTYLGMTSPIKGSINIGLNGHFDGATKNSDYRSLVKKVNDPIIMKLYFENSNDKFYLCVGNTVQKVPAGTRPLLVDYVANFFSPFGILFDETTQDGGSTGSESNDGNVVTPMEFITGAVVSGVPVTIKDGNDNGFTFTPDTTGTMIYHLIKLVDEGSDIFFTDFLRVEVEGNVQIVKNASTSADFMLRVNPGESLNDTFSGGTITGITPTFFFRNGWSSD